ncbi:MAG: arginine--tRNA ligase [Thermoplasmata archaeon]|nr:arginine--tRNA ligase [Thermoplasmata archaeon]
MNVPSSLHDPWEPFLTPLIAELSARLTERGVSVSPEALRNQLDLVISPQSDVALALHRAAKSLDAPADLLARSLAEGFPPIEGLGAIRPVGPYLNFSADNGWLTRTTISLVDARKELYGSRPTMAPPVCVEHTSANPTGPFHIGRVRNGIIGDTLARVLAAAGHPVITQYYVDDVGRQAAMITWIWSKPFDQWPAEIRETIPPGKDGLAVDPRPDLHYGRPYPAVSAYLKSHPEARDEVAELARRLEAGTSPPEHRQFAEAILGGMVASLRRIGITFDEFVWESTFLNGALALDAGSYGLPKESSKVIVTRGDGTSLYPTRDLAYHLNKFARFPRVIDVLGQDHQLHAKTLAVMLAEIGETRRPEFVIYQDITVPEGGRMSTRKGSAVYLDDLLDEAEERARKEVMQRREDLPPEEVDSIARRVASGAVRYHIVRVAPEKGVGFRWEDALSFEGRSGPFLQYSYARASSILRKSESTTFDFREADLAGPAEAALVRSISRLPGVIAYVARTSHVHTLAGYAHDLAEEFNRFYQAVPVLNAGTERESRLALVSAARQTLGNSLELLGVEQLERM